MKINKKYKYWEFYYDEDDNCQCAATHWSEEWKRLEELKKYSDEELEALILDNQSFAKTYRNEKVTKRSVAPAIKEFKQIITENQ
ncbi:hypothetical protein Elgi_37870 [Paenibacillus elgii]|uniref:hypothetical protein n=1 Tax=Paenibacillus elgii TaxID=189691 RepID=UPI002D7BD4CA|nr:hypothetical protein Elgi_37870 [Paenibacillus elgii]